MKTAITKAAIVTIIINENKNKYESNYNFMSQ